MSIVAGIAMTMALVFSKVGCRWHVVVRVVGSHDARYGLVFGYEMRKIS